MSNQQEAAELIDNAKQEFISQYCSENLARVAGDSELVELIASEATDDKYIALFDGMAELSCTGNREKLDAAINDIIHAHLESSAELAWSEMND